MAMRPYINLSIGNLENLFETSKGDPQALEGLLAELTKRSTSRAKTLRAKVEQRLAEKYPAGNGSVAGKMGHAESEQHLLNTNVHAGDLAGALAFCANLARDSKDDIICDATALEFVDPVGLCLLAATCHRLAKAGKKLRLDNVPPTIEGYLARMDLFTACGIEYKENFTRHDRRTDLVEICTANEAAEIDRLARRVAIALVGVTPGFKPDAAPDEMTGYQPHDYLYIPLHYIFSELLENALTHAKRAGFKDARAWIAAQYYPTKDRIRLAVVDDGCGFLRSLNRHPKLTDKSHGAAIRLALMPRVTCNPDLEIFPDQTANQGLGLTVVRQIVAKSRGVLRVACGDALVELGPGTRDRSCAVQPWQGALLALEFKRDLLRQVHFSNIIQELSGKTVPQGLRFE